MSIEGLLIGRVLGGRYRIEEVIGRGGMGAVYRALDERLGRLVALKVVTVSGPGDAESRQRLRARFFREARSAAALPHHPNVVPVYDYGSDEDLGLDYIVMELLRGSDLASRLARMGPPPLAASLKILLEAARGIAVGHRQGLIHRDVKPGNIFLTEPHPDEVQVRVVDFGIAKLADDEDTFGQLTQDGRVPHSPAYASPEQLRGLSHLTPASDVFSLGAVGYQMLTGERPFTDSDRNRMQLGMAVEPKPLRERNPAIPGSIDALIRKAMAIDALRRFRDADEMAAELERAMKLMADQPVEPYLAGAAIVTATDDTAPPAPGQPLSPVAAPVPAASDDDDRTRLFEEDDDRTLIVPPPPPPPAAAVSNSAPRRSSTPRRRPEPAAPPPVEPRRKRGWGGVFVWTFVLLTLLVAGMWAMNEISGSNRGPSLRDQLRPQNVPEDEPVTVDSAALVVDEPSDEELAREYDQRGRSFHAAGRFDSAYVYLAQAVELEGNVFEYRRNLGLTLLEMGSAAEAADQFRRAIQLNPVAAPTYFNLAESQLAIGDTTGGIDSLERYIAREPSRVSRASAESRLAAVRAAQNPDAPPLLGEEVESEPGGPLPGPAGPGATPGPGGPGATPGPSGPGATPGPSGPGATPGPSGPGGASTPVQPAPTQPPSQVPSGNAPRD